jgi:hypothetical protein
MADMLWVKDVNAIDETREHDLVWPDGKKDRFPFPPRKFVEIPQVLAVRWLVGNKGFEVREGGPDGQVLKMAPVAQDTARGKASIQLRNDQVIAVLDELTLEALLARVQKAGGQMTRANGKKALVDFLMTDGQPDGGNDYRPATIDDMPEGQSLGELKAA